MITKKQVCTQNYHFKGLNSKQVLDLRDPFCIARLAESNLYYFRELVSSNKHLPLACALKLIQEEDYSICYNLARTIKNKTVLHILARNKSNYISFTAKASLED